MFVGSAPLFKEEFQSKVHYTGTAISGLAAILWLCLSGLWWLPLITVNAAVGIAIFKSRWMFWLEMAAFVSTYIGLLIRIIQK